jgi:insertion element IS1 protein InsB
MVTHVNPLLLAESVANEMNHGVEMTCERDEQWGYVQNTDDQRWLWHVLDTTTNRLLAYVIGPHTDAVFQELYTLLKPFTITHYYTDGWATYKKYLPADKHTISKRGTQRIARKHLNFRTRIKRLARKTMCFSKSDTMHDSVIGLFMNRYEFGLEGQI